MINSLFSIEKKTFFLFCSYLSFPYLSSKEKSFSLSCRCIISLFYCTFANPIKKYKNDIYYVIPFSSESVSEGHPDKVADQISDAILDQFLAYDDRARVACETFVTTGQVVIMGEVRSDVYIDLQTIARNTIKRIGYTKAEYQFDGNSCGILSAIHEQSDDINRGVDNGMTMSRVPATRA